MDPSLSDDGIRFTAEAVEAFRRMSHDANPMHADPAYARRTPFGEPVVHGMLGVLAALAPVLREGPARLASLRCAFPGPLFPGTPYQATRAGAADGALDLRLAGGGALKTRVTARCEPSGPHPPAAFEASAPFTEARAPAAAELPGLEYRGRYGVDGGAAARLDALLALGLANLPPAQLQVLAWVSYCCGMLVPGRQSLIGDVDLTFGDEAGGPGPLDFAVRVERYDERFGAVRLRAELTQGARRVAEAAMTAFSRPEPLAFSLVTLLAEVPRDDALRGRVALITGASRGLGAYLAAAIGARGAEILLNYRSGRAEATELAETLAGAGIRARLAQADVADAADCGRLAAAVGPDGRLDILVNNASPPIQALTLAELGERGVADFVARSLQACLLPTRALLPALRRASGTVVAISSEYAVTAPPKFAHYVAAKGAIEGLMAGLAHEERDLRVVVARPPRLLTDQTNSNFDLGVRLHPARAAGRIVAALTRPGAPERILLVDRF